MISEETRVHDKTSVTLHSYAQNIIVVIFGLLPLIFIPSVVAPFDYSKVFIVVIGVIAALILGCLSILRSGIISMNTSIALLGLWTVAGVAFLSSLLSGDFMDSMVGDLFSIHSTMFLVLLAFIPSVWILVKPEKTSVMRMYFLLAMSTIILVLYHFLRLFFGPEFLSFGIFTSNIATPVGSWNDLGLFLGLAIILSLVTLEQLTLNKMSRTFFVFVILLSLVMLGVINFFSVWLVLGLTSLVMVVYSQGKDRFKDASQLAFPIVKPSSITSLVISLVVFAVSVLFVVGGARFGGWISEHTGVSYVEVRPTFQATMNIARNVYHENAFLGIGTNKFTDAWRLYKDDSINITPFWDTEFNAGNGYITTFFVTTGVLGGIAWVFFLLSFVIVGLKRLLSPTDADRVWYFIGVSSFVSAVYIWGMSLIYVPGVVILLLGALCTGVALSSLNILGGKQGLKIILNRNPRTGFIISLVTVVIIAGAILVLYNTEKHYAAVYSFNASIQGMQEGKSIDELEKEVAGAYALSSSDIFARRIAEYQLSRLNSLKALTAPTEAEQQQFKNASVNGINAAQQAIQIDGEEPANWSVLGGIYSVLATVKVDGATDRALEAFKKEHEYNPKNPVSYLESAFVQAQTGNYDAAKTSVGQAIALKPNFSEAFYLLSQIEIATGNVDAAITSTQTIINLEPQNPARYYQLGVLLSSQKKLDEAIIAFEQAVTLDQNYANARYLLALAYDEKSESTKALEQLEAILNLNPGNADITTLIKVIKEEGSLARLRASTNKTVPEAVPATDENGTVSTKQGSDTSLVAPVNTAPNPSTEVKTAP